MVTCSYCQTENPDDAQLCRECARPLPREVAVPSGASGWNSAIACPSCGQATPADAEFCPNCGKSVSGTSQDVVGVGRYVLNVFRAGIIGLGLTLFVRRRGWLAT